MKENIAKTPLHQLNITTQSYNLLRAAGILTIEQFLNACNDSSIKSAMSREPCKIILHHIHTLMETSHQDVPDWIAYSRQFHISILPENYVPGSAVQMILNETPWVLQGILRDERQWHILEKRFEFNGAAKLTLQGLGNTLSGISCQRIDQLYDHAIRTLRDILVEHNFTGKNYRIHPEILEFIDSMVAFFKEHAASGILENQLFEKAQLSFGLQPKTAKPVLFLLLALCGFERIDFHDSGLDPIWGKFGEKSRRIMYETAISRIDKLLTVETARPQTAVDVLRLIDQSPENSGLMPSDISIAIEACSSVEKRPDGLYWGKFEHLQGRGNQAERLLLENFPKTMRIDEIVREINRRPALPGAKKANRNNVRLQMCNNDRFFTIGKSGQWGLKTGEPIGAGTIVEMIEAYFAEKNKPATPDEIYEYISSRRPVEKRSVTVYLSTLPQFCMHDRLHWKMTKWNQPDGEIWRTDQVAAFVEDIFKKNQATVLEYKLIWQALMDATGFTKIQAQRRLSANPVLKTHPDEHQKFYATLQENYQELLRKPRRTRKKSAASLCAKVNRCVQEMLEASPNGQVLLSALVNKLREEFAFKTYAEPYNYIHRFDAVEVLILPGQTQKICRMKAGAKVEL